MIFYINNPAPYTKIKKGGFCSEHKHERKFNAFFIEKGKLQINIWKNDYDLVDKTIITDGQISIVSPMELHSFEAIEETIAYEIYWAESVPEDIIRRSVGGVNKSVS